MTETATPPTASTSHVSLVALQASTASALFGFFDAMNGFTFVRAVSPGVSPSAPFHVEIVSESAGRLELASGIPIDIVRAADAIEASDIVIVPSVVLGPDGWKTQRYPRLVA